MPATASLSLAPTLNVTALVAGILICWPVPGFLPILSGLLTTLKVPKPINGTSSPFARLSEITASIAFRFASESFLEVPALAATVEMNSALLIGLLLC